MKILLRVGIIAIFLVGGFVLRDRLGSSPTELKVGDCFDIPATANETVDDVQHHPCSETHTAEVILVTAHPAAEGATELVGDDLTLYLYDTCGAALSQVIGSDTSKFDLGAFYPTSEQWKDGNRAVTCYLTMLDESAMTVSYTAK